MSYIDVKKPYTLIIDGKLQGYYSSIKAALYAMSNIKNGQTVKIYCEDGTRGQFLVHEE